MAVKKATSETVVQISAPNLETIALQILGTAPLVQLRFSEKAKATMRDKQAAGSTAKANKKREARDFDDDFRASAHVSEDGWYGIPASALRNAMIRAARLVGMEMTMAKMAVFVEADGLDAHEGTPLVRLIGGDPERREDMVRNATGVADIRVRSMWRHWSATVRLTYDADILTGEQAVNLLDRAGRQVGVGEGRPFSKNSAGMGWGTFMVEREAEA